MLSSGLKPAAAGFQPPDRPAEPASGDEFVGPFPSWTNLKTAYHAVGDGAADDTAALQAALTDLGIEGHSPVLYIPAGRYRITGTLTLRYRINVSVVGEDPEAVSIVWDGPAGGTMLAVNGVAYSRFTRLTYDGRGRASVAIEQSWDNLKPNFDTGNEYSDHTLVDVEYGIHGGFKGYGFAETSIVRSHFVRNTRAGVSLGNFNALDIWVWYSTFDQCGIGISNEPGAGNFHVYGSVFRGSAVADLFMKNTGGFSARGNYSANAKAFFLSAGPIAHPATIELQGNTIVNSIDTATIRLGNQGPGLLLDNVVRSRPGARGPIVIWRSFIDADVTSVGNTFDVPDAVSANGRLISIDDHVAPPGRSDPAPPVLPVRPPNLHRAVFEVAAGSDAVAIQRTIERAAAERGARPVVHLPFGTYTVDRTLTLPAGDVQLVGDGFGTVLKWSGQGQGPVLHVSGPATSTLRELQVDGDRRGDAVAVDGVDQPGARVYLEQVQVRSGIASNLSVSGLRHATVDATDVGHAYTPGVSVHVSGGHVTIFSGASSGNGRSYEVTGAAQVVVRDIWYEGDAPRGFALVRGAAAFTIQGARVASPGSGTAAFTVDSLDGRVSLLTNHFDDRIVIAGSGAGARLLGLGNLREYQEANFFSNQTSPPAVVYLGSTRQRTKVQGRFSPGTTALRDIGSMDPAFLRQMLQDARSEALPAPLAPRPTGVSDVRMFRVAASNGVNNLLIGP